MGKLEVGIGILLGCWVAGVHAQGNGQASSDPCNPEIGIFGGVIPPSEARRQACYAERQGQWASYNAQQRAAEEQREAALQKQRAEEAERQESERKAEGERLAAEHRKEQSEVAARRIFYHSLLVAERSPDNHCRDSDIARGLISDWNSLDDHADYNIKAVDIEHLTTVAFNSDDGTMRCHGIFVTTRNQTVAGTIDIRKNVAGDPLVTWTADETQDLSIYEAPPAGPEITNAPFESAQNDASNSNSSNAFSDGVADRRRWEAWLDALPDAEKQGAQWWAGNRSLPRHASCEAAPDASNADWTAGCANARQMLQPLDARRKSEPLYKKGWNSI